MKSIEGILNVMTATLVRGTATEFEPDALEAWATIFNETVGRNLTQNGLKAWSEEDSEFVLRNVALTARKAANAAQVAGNARPKWRGTQRSTRTSFAVPPKP